MKRLLFILVFTLVSAFVAVSVRAEPGDDTLSLLLSKSQLVVSGTITTNAIAMLGGGLGLEIYDFTFRIEDVIKGAPEMRGQTIRVVFEVRQGSGSYDSLPLFQPNARRVLFLNEPKSSHGYWVQADEWSAIYFHSSWMLDSLKRLEREDAKN